MDIKDVQSVMLTEERVLWDHHVYIVTQMHMKLSGYNPQVKTRPFYYTLVLQSADKDKRHYSYEVMIEDVERLGG